VDVRFCEELLAAISPLGLEASLQAIQGLQAVNAQRRNALVLQLQQLDYEVQRAFDQFNAVDARNRLVAAELERRWNAKLEARENLKGKIAALETAQQPLRGCEKIPASSSWPSVFMRYLPYERYPVLHP
jgi:BMFP domain-containing protein YqiC